MTYFTTHHTLLNMDNATYNSPQTQFNFANCNTTQEVAHIVTPRYPQIKHSVHTNTQRRPCMEPHFASQGLHLVLSTNLLEEIPQLLLLPLPLTPAPRIVQSVVLFGKNTGYSDLRLGDIYKQ